MSEEKKTVTIAQDDYDNLVKRLEKVENHGLVDLDEPDVRKATVRTFKDCPVSRIMPGTVVRTGVDKATGNEKMSCSLEFVNEKDEMVVEKDVDYLMFLRDAPSLKVEIIKTNVTQKKEDSGKIEVQRAKKDGVGMIGTGVMVPNRIKWNEVTFDVMLPEGRTVTLADINIF